MTWIEYKEDREAFGDRQVHQVCKLSLKCSSDLKMVITWSVDYPPLFQNSDEATVNPSIHPSVRQAISS